MKMESGVSGQSYKRKILWNTDKNQNLGMMHTMDSVSETSDTNEPKQYVDFRSLRLWKY